LSQWNTIEWTVIVSDFSQNCCAEVSLRGLRKIFEIPCMDVILTMARDVARLKGMNWKMGGRGGFTPNPISPWSRFVSIPLPLQQPLPFFSLGIPKNPLLDTCLTTTSAFPFAILFPLPIQIVSQQTLNFYFIFNAIYSFFFSFFML